MGHHQRGAGAEELGLSTARLQALAPGEVAGLLCGAPSWSVLSSQPTILAVSRFVLTATAPPGQRHSGALSLNAVEAQLKPSFTSARPILTIPTPGVNRIFHGLPHATIHGFCPALGAAQI